jgi:ACR3 family arsenite efflux pump ArsB
LPGWGDGETPEGFNSFFPNVFPGDHIGVKKRGPIFVIIASFITLGIYLLYWFYNTTRELGEINKSDTNPLLWTIGLFIPFVNLYVFWKYSGESEKALKNKYSQLILFLAWLVFCPIAMYLTQKGINEYAKA